VAIKGGFGEAAPTAAQKAAGALRVASIRGEQVAGQQRPAQVAREGIGNGLNQGVGRAGLSVDEAADGRAGDADIGGEASTSLEAVAAGVDHDDVDAVVEPGPWPAFSRRAELMIVGLMIASLMVRARFLPQGFFCCGFFEHRLLGHCLRLDVKS